MRLRAGKSGSGKGAARMVAQAIATARLLARLTTGRTSGPVFLSERRPGPTRRGGC
jgi:hypothetical protein